MKKELYKYATQFGEALWSQKLTPRQSSGIVGKETAVVYIDVERLALIQKQNPNVTNRRALHDFVYAGLKLPPLEEKQKTTAQANTTPKNLNGIATALITGVEQWLEANKTPTEILNAFVKAGFSEAETRQVITYKITPPPTAQKTPQVPTAETPELTF
jgi:hypothetical protein